MAGFFVSDSGPHGPVTGTAMASYALIIEDHPLVARGAAEFLRARLPYLEVVVASHAQEFAPLAAERGAPAIALIDF